jgi:predicted small lipoprotein YifL
MWTKKILSLLLIILTLLMLLTACATTGDKNPLRYEPGNLPADHRPPPTSGGP